MLSAIVGILLFTTEVQHGTLAGSLTAAWSAGLGVGVGAAGDQEDASQDLRKAHGAREVCGRAGPRLGCFGLLWWEGVSLSNHAR